MRITKKELAYRRDCNWVLALKEGRIVRYPTGELRSFPTADEARKAVIVIPGAELRCPPADYFEQADVARRLAYALSLRA